MLLFWDRSRGLHQVTWPRWSHDQVPRCRPLTGRPQCRMSILGNGHVPSLSLFLQCSCRFENGLMSHVDFKICHVSFFPRVARPHVACRFQEMAMSPCRISGSRSPRCDIIYVPSGPGWWRWGPMPQHVRKYGGEMSPLTKMTFIRLFLIAAEGVLVGCYIFLLPRHISIWTDQLRALWFLIKDGKALPRVTYQVVCEDINLD